MATGMDALLGNKLIGHGTEPAAETAKTAAAMGAGPAAQPASSPLPAQAPRAQTASPGMGVAPRVSGNVFGLGGRLRSLFPGYGRPGIRPTPYEGKTPASTYGANAAGAQAALQKVQPQAAPGMQVQAVDKLAALPGVTAFVKKLFSARDTAHAMHLKYKGLPKHLALGEFYDALLPLVDEFVETYQGQYGLIEQPTQLDVDTEGDPKAFVQGVCDAVRAAHGKLGEGDTHLQNLLDEILGLGYRTLYKLENLDCKTATDRLLGKQAKQDNKAPQRSASGDPNGLKFQHKEDDYAKGPEAITTLDRYLRKSASRRAEAPNSKGCKTAADVTPQQLAALQKLIQRPRRRGETPSDLSASVESRFQTLGVDKNAYDSSRRDESTTFGAVNEGNDDSPFVLSFMARCKASGLHGAKLASVVEKAAAFAPEAAGELRKALEKEAFLPQAAAFLSRAGNLAKGVTAPLARGWQAARGAKQVLPEAVKELGRLNPAQKAHNAEILARGFVNKHISPEELLAGGKTVFDVNKPAQGLFQPTYGAAKQIANQDARGALGGLSRGLYQTGETAGKVLPPAWRYAGKPLLGGAMGAMTGSDIAEGTPAEGLGGYAGFGLGALMGSPAKKFLPVRMNRALRSAFAGNLGGQAVDMGAGALGIDTEGAGARWGGRLGLGTGLLPKAMQTAATTRLKDFTNGTFLMPGSQEALFAGGRPQVGKWWQGLNTAKKLGVGTTGATVAGGLAAPAVHHAFNSKLEELKQQALQDPQVQKALSMANEFSGYRDMLENGLNQVLGFTGLPVEQMPLLAKLGLVVGGGLLAGGALSGSGGMAATGGGAMLASLLGSGALTGSGGAAAPQQALANMRDAQQTGRYDPRLLMARTGGLPPNAAAQQVAHR